MQSFNQTILFWTTIWLVLAVALVGGPYVIFIQVRRRPGGRLMLAKWALAAKNRGLAKDRLKDIVRRFPASDAAREAQALLDEHFPRAGATEDSHLPP
jgi:hypothetical protein